MAADTGMKLAVLIDGENISSKYIKTILDEASNHGNIIYKRIYGDWTNPHMAAWRDVILDHSIQPIQQYSNTVGKNSSDSAMIIDAMDLLYTGRLDGFCLVSSDSDFTRLAARLRESEVFVIGMGERKTPKSFINACNKFAYLDILYQEDKQETAAAAPAKMKRTKSAAPAEEKPEPSAGNTGAGADKQQIIHAIQALIEQNSDEDGWIFSGTLGNQLNKRFPDFDVRNFGFRKFTPFIKSLGMFEVKMVTSKDGGNNRLVYIRNKTDNSL